MTMPDRLATSPPAADVHDPHQSQPGPDNDVLMELHRDLAAVVAELTKVVERRAAEAEAVAQRTLENTSQIIRLYPVAAIAVAMLLGAGVARFAMPTRHPTRQAMHLPAWPLPAPPAAWMQSARDLPASAAGSSPFASLASILERVVSEVATLDPKAQLSPMLDRAGAWLSGLKATVGGK